MGASLGPGIVIVGLGPAAVNALEGIRSQDVDVPVTILSQEPYYAYYRPRLSHLLGEEVSSESLAIKKPQWYEERNAQVLLGQTAKAINVDRKTVSLDNGSELSASSVILACGSSPFVPPLSGLDRENVFSLRTVDDARAISSACETAKTVCVVGAGPLGLEAAWALAKRDLEVHLLEHGSRLLSKMLDQNASRMLAEIVESAGIVLHLSAFSEALFPGGIRLAGGEEIPGEVILFSTGVRPNLDVPRSAGLKINRGVEVDKLMRTSTPWIYAAGDVAEFEGSVGGILPVAVAQGKVAGVNAAGGQEEYVAVPPSYTLMVMGTRLFSVGDVQDGPDVTSIVEVDYDSRVYRKLVLSGDKVVGGILFGDIAGSDKIRRAVEEGVQLPGAAKESVPDYASLLDMIVRY